MVNFKSSNLSVMVYCSTFEIITFTINIIFHRCLTLSLGNINIIKNSVECLIIIFYFFTYIIINILLIITYLSIFINQ